LKNSSKTRLKAGFTLIELLIVVAILGIIASLGIPTYNGYIQSSKESVAKNSLKSISLLQADYYSENNKYLTNGVNSSQYINSKLFNGRKTLDEQGATIILLGLILEATERMLIQKIEALALKNIALIIMII